MEFTPHSLMTLPADHYGLYVHVPFCVCKCRYCDFASQPLCQEAGLSDRYLDALVAEADLRRREYPRTLHSIFIGGGTPTTLTGAQLRRLWRQVIAPFPRIEGAEISIEANPGTLTADVLAALAEMPLTRVSLGAQSFQPRELAMLGRIHSPDDVVEAVAALRGIGIPQLNLDLMYGLPTQTPASWEETLRQALALRPEHLSTYSLIVEDGTPLAAQIAAGALSLPAEEAEETMARTTALLLTEAGYTQYEVSNAARDGAFCRHNLGYWLGRDYLGLGPSAASTMGALRWRNVDDAAGYATRLSHGQPVIVYAERLSARERLLERVMLGLRLRGGFDLATAEAECGCRLAEIAPQTLAALQTEGLLSMDGRILRLTDAGFLLANAAVTRLMAESE